MQQLIRGLRQSGLIRFMEHFAELYPDLHLKDLVVDEIRQGREIVVGGRTVINFGSDSFLGLDQDPRVIQAIRDGLERWGTHNGASRAFASVRANIDAEEKLAQWLGTESCLIYPSVTLANLGAIPGLVSKQDLLIVDEHAHNSIQDGARLSRANGVRVESFSHCDPVALAEVFRKVDKYRVALVAIDGVYSMSGELPPLGKLNEVCLANNAILYVDDAHATGVMGTQGRGTVMDALGSYDNTLVVGSLSKGFSCAGGFIGCSSEMQQLLKMRSNTWIFGGPVVPAYLDAVCVVCDILSSGEYTFLAAKMTENLNRLKRGLDQAGFVVQGGSTPIVSVLVGAEEDTFRAGHRLFERGWYVQSVTFPAVPYHAGVLRIQVNANHTRANVEGLLAAMRELRTEIAFPSPSSQSWAKAA
jgi:7-keto-8-aminopelargonate synthetase-like enzyme